MAEERFLPGDRDLPCAFTHAPDVALELHIWHVLATAAWREVVTGESAPAVVELNATGARPRRHALRGADALTPSERRVAELAATGASNRDIAQALFITIRTVELHLTHAYSKLGIRSRSDLARALEGERPRQAGSQRFEPVTAPPDPPANEFSGPR